MGRGRAQEAGPQRSLGYQLTRVRLHAAQHRQGRRMASSARTARPSPASAIRRMALKPTAPTTKSQEHTLPQEGLASRPARSFRTS